MYGNNPFPPFYNNINSTPLRGPSLLGRATMSPNLFRGTNGGLGNILRGGANAGGIFSKLKGSGITLGNILTNTQKTLNVVNQAIPIIKQTGPMFNNMKTMFRLASAFKDETSNTKTTPKEKEKEKSNENDNNNLDNTKENVKENDTESKHNNEPNFFI